MSIAELLPVALLGAVLGLDVVSFPQAMISRPIVASTLAGALAGSAASGVLAGAILELFALEMLAVGASRYPEWGTASVVGGALFARMELAGWAGALPVSIATALLTAWLGGWSMYLLRRVNGVLARKRLKELDAGSRSAVLFLQLTGLTADLVRGGLLTLLAMIAFAPAAQYAGREWAFGAARSEAVLLALAVATAGAAGWRLFHAAAGARWLFLGGAAAGTALIALR
ncbi:MAG: PTS sugar transporter subunit IIC [Anaerolineae bacterium]|nr:PTS sugar transporter subunit IIC [Gemmatimonadaceae bacterium]